MALEADLLFDGGPVFTGLGELVPANQPVAVAGGRIVAVGPAARNLMGPKTERVSLKGRLLVPGFQDAHIHPISGGLVSQRCDLSAAEDADECARILAKFAADNRRPRWIVGAGCALDILVDGESTSAVLNAVVTDRPVFLLSRDHHSGWANLRALQEAGIGLSTPDPPDGIIERCASSSPTGVLREGALALVERVLPKPADADIDRALDEAQSLLHSLGITAWQDALIGSALGMPDGFETYVRAAESGRLTARVRGAQWWERDQGLEQIDRLLARREFGRSAGNGRFDPGTVKIMQDGVVESGTALLKLPYSGGHVCCRAAGGSAGTGMSFLTPEVLAEVVAALDRQGFQLHFHAIGDRAISQVLAALEAAAVANGYGDCRHHIAHLQLLDAEDVLRFAMLDVSANAQPLWACTDPRMDALTRERIGPDRAAQQYPLASLVDTGVELAFGSDWPISSPDPLAGIHVAVNRVAPGSDDEPLAKEQGIALGHAMSAYTRGSALVNHLDETGLIRPGMLADLVVLENNPFDGPEHELYDNWAVATYVGGEQVF